MLSEGIRLSSVDGLLEINEEYLQKILVKNDISDIYDVEQTPFARGKFGTVRRVVHKKTGIKYAAKFLRRRRRAQCWAKDISHEIAVLMLCAESKHIVKLHAVHETKVETALILELVTGGELQAILDDEMTLTEAETRSCLREVLKALEFMHKKRIAHLDLKPQNILLSGEKVEDGLKLCDFGISRVVEDGGKVCEILGTPDYVAPEVLNYEPLSLQTDIWSVGVLAYVLLTGCSPFAGENKQETFLNISQCSLTFPDELFEDISNDAIDFIKSTLRIKPRDRLSVSGCLEHHWIKDSQIITTTTPTPVCSPLPLSATTTFNNKINQLNDNTNNILLSSSNNNLNHSSNGIDKDNMKVIENNNNLDMVDGENDNKENLNLSQSLINTTTIPLNPSIMMSSQSLNGQSSSSASSSVVAVTTSSSSCIEEDEVLFPEAPTTPKVCRKTANESMPSAVKMLAKKLQQKENSLTMMNNDVNIVVVESNDKQILSSSSSSSTTTIMTTSSSVTMNGSSHLQSPTPSSPSTTTTSASATCCNSCSITCDVTVTTNNKTLQLDKGIIC